jgi:hypothetical protein
VPVVVWATSDESARTAKADGLNVYHGDPREDAAEGAPSELDELEYALAVSDDDGLNAVVASDLSEYFGREHVYQLPVKEGEGASFYTRAQVLFDAAANHDDLAARLDDSRELVIATAPSAASRDVSDRLGPAGIPMFIYTPGKHLHIVTAGDRPALDPGQELIGLRGPGE